MSLSMKELLDEKRIPYREHGQHHHCREGWLQLDCPFCSRDWEHFRLGYNLHSKYFSCWACGWHPLSVTLRELLNISVGYATELAYKLAAELRYEKERIEGTLSVPPMVTELWIPHKNYLRKRGFEPEIIEEVWGIKGIGPYPPHPWRIWIPVVTRGEIVTFTMRSLSDKGLRYIHAKPSEEKIPIKSLLYGEDLITHGVIVCEGPLDVWQLGPGAVCTFGTVVTREQTMKIARYPVRVICFDNEPTAQKAANKLAEDLAVFPGKTINVCLDSKDPGCATGSEITRLKELIQ